MNQNTWLPTRAEERRAILKISGPLIAAYLAEMGMVITDMIIVGRLGSKELAAVGLGGDWFYVLLLIGIGVLSIVGVLIAQALGAGQNEKVMPYVRQGMVAAVLTAIPISLLTWFLSPILSLTPQDPEVLDLLDQYMKTITLAVLPGLFYVVFRNYLTALENTSSMMVLTFVALFLNAFLNIVLVHGKLGMPAMGVAGAGLGTSIVHWVVLLFLYLYLVRKKLFSVKELLATTKAQSEGVLREIFVLGFPISASHILAGGLFTVAAVMMGVLSAAHLAAQQLVYALLYSAISIAIGIGDAAKVRVAYALGKQSRPAIAQAANQSLLFGLVVGLVLALAFWFIPDLMISVFLDLDDADNRSAVTVALTLVVFAGFFQIVDILNVIIGNALRGLRDTRSPMWASLIGYWFIGLTLAWLFCFQFNAGGFGIWSGMLIGVTLSCGFMLWRFRRHMATPL